MNRVAVSLIGASTRAAAFSAWRAGWQVRASDLFGDGDLRLRASFEPLSGEYPSAFVDFVEGGPDTPWMYTGGLENHPGLIERMAESRPVWGNTGATLREVGDPFVLSAALREGGFDCPESSPDSRSSGAAYLLKPLRGSGGRRIRFAPGSAPSRRASRATSTATPTLTATTSTSAPRGYFYQRFLSGQPCSVVYVGDASGSRTLGVTRQLIGATWLHASPFAWCGNIGPIRLAGHQRDLLERLGPYLVERFGLQGLFGVDFVIPHHDPGALQIIEVNPRYPASLDVLELATGQAALPLHRAAFENTKGVTWTDAETASTGVVGKAVLFARNGLVITEDLLSCVAVSPFDVPVAADLPAPGTGIAEGRPVLSVYEYGETEAECRRRLKSAARRFERRLLDE